MNTNPMHFDEEYASHSDFGKPLVNSCLALSLVTGISVSDISQNSMANLAWDEIRLPIPVFEGDTIYARSEILETRESKSRSNVGIGRFRTVGFNQRGESVIESARTILVYKRAHLPTTPKPAAIGMRGT